MVVDQVSAGYKPQILDEINEHKILIVEGKDEQNFFMALFRELKICGCGVYPVGGKTRFRDLLPAFMMARGFDKVVTLGIIRDADMNADSAFKSIAGVLSRNRLPVPLQIGTFTHGHAKPRVGVFILPNNRDHGCLETLCLDSVDSHASIECVDKAFECIGSLGIKMGPIDLFKARAQVFLSFKDPLVQEVGIAARKGHWDFNSQPMSLLAKFVRQM